MAKCFFCIFDLLLIFPRMDEVNRAYESFKKKIIKKKTNSEFTNKETSNKLFHEQHHETYEKRKGIEEEIG